MTATDSRPAVDADHRRRDRRQPALDRRRDGLPPARMSYSSIIRESEDFGCALCDHERRQLCESTQSTPLQSGPIPGYLAGIDRALRGGRRRVARRRRRHPQPPVLRRLAPARRRVRRPGLPRRRARRLLRHHRAPPRPRRAHARARAGSSTRATRTPRACCSTRSRSRRPGGATRAGVADHRRQHALPDLVVGDMEAQVAAAQLGATRYARAGAARTAWRRCAPRPSSSDGPLRADAAQRDRGAAGRHLPRRGLPRRLPRPPRPRATATCASRSP